MEKNNEKAAYFAQYWGQDVLICTYQNTPNVKQVNGAYMLTNQPDEHLLLTPLSDITDEDAIEVAKIWGGFQEAHVGKRLLKSFYGQSNLPYWFCQQTLDYLRSKSYALPFRQYSVEQLIEMGWLKLKLK